ncbi:Modulator of FtsH protease YccA [Pontiella desulfatans]|uniref:Modulator of FtsH protease YccA n=1 Tax=Pontiella desulfatans TaxID=2750659 RepID=A0A6C2U573_PONDE|nr:Bax inhibitor-1 family protein [Pontiella desulfatans]VGO14691.1 Modulator of FtsH protease YccA [Pontiella desulfatans]
MNPYAQQLTTVAQSAPDERAAFIRKTYAHLAGAVLAFVGLTAYMVNSPIAEMLLSVMSMRFGWLLILGGFMIFGRMASGLASSTSSQNIQYVGLTLYVIIEAVIFAPILWIATYMLNDATVIPTAGILTLGIFGGLTLVVFTTKKDFSFLGGILKIGFIVALALIVCAVLFGFNLGLVFSFAMVLLASGAILYDTSRIIHNYAPGQHVAASLQLFASVALLFWYVLQIVMSFSRR